MLCPVVSPATFRPCRRMGQSLDAGQPNFQACSDIGDLHRSDGIQERSPFEPRVQGRQLVQEPGNLWVAAVVIEYR